MIHKQDNWWHFLDIFCISQNDIKVSDITTESMYKIWQHIAEIFSFKNRFFSHNFLSCCHGRVGIIKVKLKKTCKGTNWKKPLGILKPIRIFFVNLFLKLFGFLIIGLKNNFHFVKSYKKSFGFISFVWPKVWF